MAHLRSSNLEPKWILVFVFFAAGGFFGGLGIYLYSQATSIAPARLHLPRGTYRYINPTLATEPLSDYSNFSTVSSDVELKTIGILTEAQKRGGVTNASLYFRDFEAGKWLASNANEHFSPGTLLKIPIMIAYYKIAEQNPAVLDEKIHFDGAYLKEEDVFSPSAAGLAPGADYSVTDLIMKMMRDSDETAAGLLFDHINKTTLNEVFSDLGIDFNEDKETRDYISLKRYSLFLRVLYNGTYLTPEYSEKALAMLAQDQSRSLLEKNLPQSILFANRVGGRSFGENGSTRFEVYECDIVYYPSHNYMLCATAQSSDLQAIKNLFAKIGSIMYEDMTYHYGQ